MARKLSIQDFIRGLSMTNRYQNPTKAVSVANRFEIPGVFTENSQAYLTNQNLRNIEGKSHAAPRQSLRSIFLSQNVDRVFQGIRSLAKVGCNGISKEHPYR